MLYRQKKDTYIRNYDGIGYITSTGIFNDRIVNKSGTIFLCALSREPKSIEQLVDAILPSFTDVDRNTVINDAVEFYDALVEDGFLVKGENKEELDSKDIGFSYDAIIPKTIREDFTPVIKRADSDTQTMLEEQFKGKPYLTSFQIELTSRCNERCVHCYIPHDLKLHDITDELYYSVLEQLSELGVLNVTLSGGEPMLHPHFVDFLRAAKKYDFYVNILTNLTALTDEIILAMKEINVSSVQVSLYSLNPIHHDAITTIKGSCEKTKKAILKLIENNIPVQVACPVMKENKDDFNDVVEWCHNHKIRAQIDYMIMAEYNHNVSNLSHRLSSNEVADVIETIINNDKYYQNEVLNSDFEKNCKEACFNPDRRLCGVGISSCCMVANGNIYPCPGWQEYVIGNLYKSSLKTIWEESDKIKFLRRLTMKDLGNGECCNCESAAFCSPCMVRNANESPSGNPLEINRHFCDVAKINKEIVLRWISENKK